MIEIKNVSKNYGNNKALKNISFSVNKGEILGFLGPNGAGKSTTMKIITGYITPTEGTVLIDDSDILDNHLQAKKKIGYLPENPPLYDDMLVESYLKFVGELKGLENKKINQIVKEVMEMLNIAHVKGRLIRNLSKGYKQRVGIAQAIMSNPDVLILDEPTIGLDPSQIMEMRQLIRKLGEDRTIILSTHILSEVSQICDRVIIINKGEIVAVDTPEKLSRLVKQTNAIEARIVGDTLSILNIIKSINGVENVEMLGERESGSIDYRIESSTDQDLRVELFKEMAKADFPIIELKTVKLSLEDVFLQLTSDEAALKEVDGNESNNGNM